jgi:hypothetical protein
MARRVNEGSAHAAVSQPHLEEHGDDNPYASKPTRGHWGLDAARARTRVLRPLALAAVMLGAIGTHLFVIGGNPSMPVVLLAATVYVAWTRRAD